MAETAFEAGLTSSPTSRRWEPLVLSSTLGLFLIGGSDPEGEGLVVVVGAVEVLLLEIFLRMAASSSFLRPSLVSSSILGLGVVVVVDAVVVVSLSVKTEVVASLVVAGAAVVLGSVVVVLSLGVVVSGVVGLEVVLVLAAGNVAELEICLFLGTAALLVVVVTSSSSKATVVDVAFVFGEVTLRRAGVSMPSDLSSSTTGADSMLVAKSSAVSGSAVVVVVVPLLLNLFLRRSLTSFLMAALLPSVVEAPWWKEEDPSVDPGAGVVLLATRNLPWTLDSNVSLILILVFRFSASFFESGSVMAAVAFLSVVVALAVVVAGLSRTGSLLTRVLFFVAVVT